MDSVLGVGPREVSLLGGSKLTTICIWRAEWAFHPVGDVFYATEICFHNKYDKLKYSTLTELRFRPNDRSFAQPQGGGARGVAFLGGITATIANGSQTEKDCPSLFRYNCESHNQKEMCTHMGNPSRQPCASHVGQLCRVRAEVQLQCRRGPTAHELRAEQETSSCQLLGELISLVAEFTKAPQMVRRTLQTFKFTHIRALLRIPEKNVFPGMLPLLKSNSKG